MPPKLRKPVDLRSEEVVGEDTELEFSVSSPISAASTTSVAASVTVPLEYLQRILEANSKVLEDNQRSMSAMFASLATPSVTSEPAPKTPPIVVPKWSDGETPFEYFSKYEQALTHNGVDRGKWGSLLQVYLSGKAQASFAQVNPTILKDYDQVKQAMLESLGDTPDGADKRWCTLSRQRDEDHRALYLRVHSTGFRRMHGLETKEGLCQRMILSKFLSLLSPECYSSVVAKRPRNGQEAARYVQEFEEETSFARTLQFRPNGSQYQQNPSFKREQGGSHNGGSSSNGSSSGTNDGNTSGSSSSPPKNQGTSNYQAGGGQGGRQDKLRERKPITCYGCGEVGHIRPNCPNKVRRVKPEKKKSMVMTVDGYLAGKAVKGLRLDTGADRTVVKKEFVPEDAYTGETVVLDSWRGQQTSRHKVARIAIRVGSVEIVGDVAVDDTLDHPALLGTDLGEPFEIETMEKVVEQLKESLSVNSSERSEKVEFIRQTRAQVLSEQERERADEEASAQAESTPVPLSDILDLPDSYFEEDLVPTPVAEWSTWPEEGEVLDIPLPNAVSEVADSSSSGGSRICERGVHKCQNCVDTPTS